MIKYDILYDNFVSDIEKIPDNELLHFGDKDTTISNAKNIFLKIIGFFDNIYIENCDYVVIDYGGIGDCIHSRLLVQNLAKNNKICWIVPPLVFDLYKDDNVSKTYKGFTIPFRNPFHKICNIIIEYIHKIIIEKFKDYKIIDNPFNILQYYIKVNVQSIDFYFLASGVNRDYNIKHCITHNGKLSDINIKLKEKYVVLEYNSLTFGSIADLNKYDVLIKKLNKLNIDVVCVGGLSDKKLNYGIDCRGMSLYDVFTLIKNSVGFIGRNSGNQQLLEFLPDIPVFEIDVHPMFYRKTYNLSHDTFIDFIYDYYKIKS